MTNERAIEILDPTHVEQYESMEPVNEACRMGMDALSRMIPKSLQPKGFTISIMACQTCGSREYLYTRGGKKNHCCGLCGQAIDWD